jgi:NAD(P)-dependent dehydrogenase (short-subunit alcohol dehydrogenase family)
MHLLPISQQVVVVMGASSGIGRATALAFAARGAKVVVSARSAEGLSTLVEEIRDKGGTALAVVADVAAPEQMKKVADQAIAEFYRIDTWVHVAAVSIWARAEDTRPEELRRVVEVNLLGQIHGAQAALPHLRRRGGALVHVSSIEAKIALPFNSVYAASKHGLSGFIDALRLELRREGAPVSVTQIMPAGIDTPLFQVSLTRLGVEPRPAPPVYEPELVAEAILYAAAHPVRELVVGGAGVSALLAQRLAPRFLDEVLLGASGFEAQLGQKPKGDDAPNNLFAPTPAEYLKVKGAWSAEARSHSLATRIQQTAVARIGERVLRAGQAVVARLYDALYVLTFRRQLPGVAPFTGGEGAGMPAPLKAPKISPVLMRPAAPHEAEHEAGHHPSGPAAPSPVAKHGARHARRRRPSPRA